ncbi:MAG: hypothetical protein R6W71_08445 [Bacteroidales bacterium]|jgi:hypothetical protein
MKKFFLMALLLFLTGLVSAQQVDHTSDADAIAKEMANANTTLGSLNLQFDYIHYRGNLPYSDQQNSISFSFQPILPYPVKQGLNIFLRPLIPVVIAGPVYTESEGFQNKSGLGDIAIDLVVGKTWKSKWVTLFGLETSLPTGTGSLSSGRTTLGPDFYFGKNLKGGAIGLLLYQTWTLNKNDELGAESITGGQYFYAIFLKNAWQIQSGPVWSYNNKANGTKWTLPLGTGVAKIWKFNKTPVMFAVEYWYYLASADPIGPQHLVRLQVAPVVPLPWGGKHEK